MRFAKLGLAVAFGAVLVACSGEREAGKAEAQKEPEAGPAKVAKQVKPEPAAPEPEAEAAVASTEPERRFEMTRDGEAQTAENFEAWMDEQGIRVADGGQAGAEAPARKPEVAPVEKEAIGN